CWTAPAPGQVFNNGTGTFTWNDPLNWTPNGVPNGSGASATFNVTGAMTVTLDAAIAVGSLTVNNSVASFFSVQNGTGGPLTFANGGSEAALVLNGTSNTTNNLTMAASLALTDTLRVTVNNTVASAALTSSPLTFTGAITGAGGFIKDGPGRF